MRRGHGKRVLAMGFLVAGLGLTGCGAGAGAGSLGSLMPILQQILGALGGLMRQGQATQQALDRQQVQLDRLSTQLANLPKGNGPDKVQDPNKAKDPVVKVEAPVAKVEVGTVEKPIVKADQPAGGKDPYFSADWNDWIAESDKLEAPEFDPFKVTTTSIPDGGVGGPTGLDGSSKPWATMIH